MYTTNNRGLDNNRVMGDTFASTFVEIWKLRYY